MTKIKQKIDVYNQDWNKLLKKAAFRGFNINQIASDLETADSNDVTYRANSKRTLISFGNTNINLNKIAKGEEPWSFSRLIHRIKLACSDEYKTTYENKIAKLAELIQEKLKIDKITTPEGKVELPLIKAAEEGDLEKVTALINSGANYDIQNEQGRTPLMLALANKHFAIAQALLDVKAKVNIRDSEGSTTLMFAAQAGDFELFEKILSKDPNVNEKNKKGRQPITFAAKSGNLEIVKALLEQGNDVNAADNEGYTPLLGAAKNGHLEIVKALLEQGADANKGDHSERSPLLFAANNGHFEMVKALLVGGADANARSSYIMYGDTSLMFAVRKGYSEIVKVLLDHGADVNKTGLWGDSPLMSAAQDGHLEIVKALLDHGADISIVSEGMTVLDAIKLTRPTNYRERVDLVKTKEPALKDRNKEYKYRKQLAHAWALLRNRVYMNLNKSEDIF